MLALQGMRTSKALYIYFLTKLLMLLWILLTICFVVGALYVSIGGSSLTSCLPFSISYCLFVCLIFCFILIPSEYSSLTFVLFCPHLQVFDCRLHGCSQDLIFPVRYWSSDRCFITLELYVIEMGCL